MFSQAAGINSLGRLKNRKTCHDYDLLECVLYIVYHKYMLATQLNENFAYTDSDGILSKNTLKRRKGDVGMVRSQDNELL